MPGTLKLPPVSSLHHSHKPHPNWVHCLAATTTAPSTSSSTTTSGRPSYSISTARRWWWWCRITPCVPRAQFKISNRSFITDVNRNNNHYLKLVGFCGQKLSYSSYSSSSEEKGQGYNSKSNRSGLATDMGASLPPDDNKDQHHQDCPKLLPPPSSQSAKLLTLPTILTVGRVAAVPLLVSTFYVDSWWGPTLTTGVFIAAAITDWLDGYIARKMKLGSAFGAFLDPVADKLMVAATLMLLCTRPLEVGIFGQVPWLLTVPAIAIIGREITMSAVREWAASQDGKLTEAVAVNNLGKWKTATQMTALTILLATRDNSLIGSETLVASGVVLLYISAWLSMWSLVVYMRKIWKVLLM